MPKFLEDRLRAEASRKGFKGERADRYVYGAMNNMGAMRGSKETAKGAAMERKHEREHGGAEKPGERPNPSTHTPLNFSGHPMHSVRHHSSGGGLKSAADPGGKKAPGMDRS